MAEVSRPTPAQIKHYEKVVKPQIEKAAKKLPKKRLKRAAELGGEIAVAELERRGERLPTIKGVEGIEPTAPATKEERKVAWLQAMAPAVKELGLKSPYDLTSVDPKYAEQHPGAVIKIGDYFYRPRVLVKTIHRLPGETTEEYVARRDEPEARSVETIKRLKAEKKYKDELTILEKHKDKGDYNITQAVVAGVSAETLDKFFGKKSMKKYWKSMPSEVAEKARTLQQKQFHDWLRAHPDIVEKSQVAQLKAFEASHIKLKDSKDEDIWIPLEDWNKWPEKYQTIALKNNLDRAMQAQENDIVKFKSEHTELADNTWVPNEEWASLPSKYQKIGEQSGFKAMLATMKEDESRGTIAGNLERAKEATSWFNKAKAFLGLTEDDITEAQARFLTTPSLPKADKGTPKLSARQMLSILVPTIAEQPVETKKASFSDVLKAIVGAEKKKIEIGTMGLSLSISRLAPELTGKLKTFAEPLPVGLEQAIKFGGALSLGALSAPVYTAIVGGHLVQVAWAPDKISKLTDLGKGMADFLISIPATIAAEPALATGFYTGLFIVGPEGMVKIIKSVGARGVPAYIPARGMGIEYSVVRVPTKIASKSAVITATNQAIARAMRNKSGTATVKVGDGLVKLKIKSTPVSEVVGPALYHATPALVDALKKGQIKGTLYTSPHLAVRFAESSAKGTPQANPAILMIFSKEGKVKWSPTTNLYKGAKEMEAVYGTTKLERVKSLWARLTFDKFGDFITVYKGETIPIYRFKEPGAAAPRIGPSELTSIRIKSAAAALADLVKGKKGYEIIKDTTKEAGRAEIELLIKPYEYLLKALRKMYRANPDIERLYRLDPERFERTYLEELNRQFEQASKKRPFIAGERFTEIEKQQIERGIIPERLRRIIPREERITEQITRLRPPIERIPPERVPPEQVPPTKEPPPKRSPPEKPPKEPPPVLIQTKDETEKRKGYEGAVAWAQGRLKRKGGKLVTQYKVWKYPYRQVDLEHFVEGEVPPGVKIVSGISSAKETIQQFRGKVAPKETQQADIGAFIATVSKPTAKPGGAGEIKFARDVRGESDEALRKIVLGTSVKQLLKEIYSAKVPKKTADRMLSDKLSKMTAIQITSELTKADISKTRRREALKMLPDRERKQVELMLSEPEMFAPTRGTPKAKRLPSYLRRKKAKTKKAKSEPTLVGARL